VVEPADVGFDVRGRCAAQQIHLVHPGGVSPSGDDLDKRDPDRVRAVDVPYGKDPSLPAAIDKLSLKQAKPARRVEIGEEEDVGEPFGPLQPFRVLRKDLDRPSTSEKVPWMGVNGERMAPIVRQVVSM